MRPGTRWMQARRAIVARPSTRRSLDARTTVPGGRGGPGRLPSSERAADRTGRDSTKRSVIQCDSRRMPSAGNPSRSATARLATFPTPHCISTRSQPLGPEQVVHGPVGGARGEASACMLDVQPVADLGISVLAMDVPAHDTAGERPLHPDYAVKTVTDRFLALQETVRATLDRSGYLLSLSRCRRQYASRPGRSPASGQSSPRIR
jgi:hypothetical protein